MSAGIRAGSSNDGYVQVNGNDIITALSGGNVGIGVSSPSTKLHVNGTITATNFAGSSGITTDDWIVHAGDTDTKLGFPAADQIQFNTAGTNYLKLHRYSSVNFVEVGSGAHISFAANGSGSRNILIGDGNASSTGKILIQSGGGSTGFGGGISLYSHANSTNAGGVYIGKSLNSSGSIIFGNGGTTPSHEYLKINSSGKSSFKSQGTNTVCISLLDNDSSNEIWRVGQASDGDGYVEVLEDGGTVGCKLDASGNSFTMGNFGIGVASPGELLHLKTASGNCKIRIDAAATPSLDFYEAGTRNSDIMVDHATNNLIVTNRQNANITFRTNGTNERLRIDNVGRHGINVTNTGDYYSASDDLIIREKDGGDSGITIRTGTANSGLICFADGASSSSDQYRRGQIRYHHNSDSMDFTTAGNDARLTITSGGQLNIGGDYDQTTYKTQIETTNGNVLRLVTDSDDANGVELVLRKDSASPADNDNIGNIYFQGNDDGGNDTFYSSIEAYSDDVSNNSENGYIRFRTRNDGSMGERLRIKSNGRVIVTGGGDTNSNYGLFQVNQAVDNDEGGIAIFNDANNRSMRLYCDASANSVINSGNGGGAALVLNEGGGAVKMSGRSFTMGTFSSTGGSVGIQGNGWSNNEIGIRMSHKVSGGQSFFVFYNTNGQVGYIQSSGSGTIYNTGSDYRLKENQVLISDGITRLKQLKPYRFNFKKDPSTTLDGFFAHEVQPVVPEAIAGTKDEVATKDEGGRKKGDPILQGMDYGRITPLLTAALQEAIAKIEVLETKVAALESS